MLWRGLNRTTASVHNAVMSVSRDDIEIRNRLVPGDLGYVIHMHGRIYGQEQGYGLEFEGYVAHSMQEFLAQYNSRLDRVWLCEHDGRIVGSLFAMHRGEGTAQLRYFLIEPEYRGIGLGKVLMEWFLRFMEQCGYRAAYLLTAPELAAAAALYTRYGFVLTAERPSPSFGKPEIEQRYELVLRP